MLTSTTTTTEATTVTTEKTPTEVKVSSENDNNSPALPETGEQSGKLTTITGLLALASVVLGTIYYKKSQKD